MAGAVILDLANHAVLWKVPMSFLKKLFGAAGESNASAPAIVEEVEHKGYRIATVPIPEGGQYRVAADISCQVDGEEKTHKLIRADMCHSRDEASSLAIQKARQTIDERGDRIFGVS